MAKTTFTKLASKVAERLGISDLARIAKTSGDYENVIAKIDADIDGLVRGIAKLEAQLETAILNGEDDAAIHQAILENNQRIQSLRAAHAEASRRRDQVTQDEAAAALETEARVVRETSLINEEQGWREYHRGLRALIDAGYKIEVNAKAVADFNDKAKHLDRPDLVVPQTARARVATEVAPALYAPAEIQAPKPPVRKDPPKQLGEREENYRQRCEVAWQDEMRIYQSQFDLRQQNAAYRAEQHQHTTEPFRIEGERASQTIERVSFPQDAFTSVRNRRRTNLLTWFDPNSGTQVRKTVDLDGRERRASTTKPGSHGAHPNAIRAAE